MPPQLFILWKNSPKNNKALTVQCNAKCIHWSYYLPVGKHNKGGCNGDHQKFTLDTVTCFDCEDITENKDKNKNPGKKLRVISKKGTYDVLSKISVKGNRSYHQSIYDAISAFKDHGNKSLNHFTNYQDCEDFLELHFSHLNPNAHNIFKPNHPEEDRLAGLHLPLSSLKRVICSIKDGWLDDHIFTQMADLLNFYEEFEPATGEIGKGKPTILFGDGYSEPMSINPNHLPQTSHTYKLINGAVPSNMKHV